jgi:hypothetical protein
MRLTDQPAKVLLTAFTKCRAFIFFNSFPSHTDPIVEAKQQSQQVMHGNGI